jgi:hypothetical protein
VAIARRANNLSGSGRPYIRVAFRYLVLLGGAADPPPTVPKGDTTRRMRYAGKYLAPKFSKAREFGGGAKTAAAIACISRPKPPFKNLKMRRYASGSASFRSTA